MRIAAGAKARLCWTPTRFGVCTAIGIRILTQNMIQHRGLGLRFWPSAVGNGCQGTIGVKRTGRLSEPVMVERLYTSTPAGTAVSVTGQSPFTTGARRCPVAALTQKVAAIPARTFLLSRAEKSAEFVCARGVSTERPGTNFQQYARFMVITLANR